jgi:hypothetical protein
MTTAPACVRASQHLEVLTLSSASDRWKTGSNPYGQWQTEVSEDALVLHYAYSYRSDIADKAAVSCAGAGYLAAARRGDRAKVSTRTWLRASRLLGPGSTPCS